MIFSAGYKTPNLGVIINFLLMIIDDIAYLMNTISNIENNFVSFQRCEKYLHVEAEHGYKYFETIENFILKKNSKKIDFAQLKEKLEKKNESVSVLQEPLLDNSEEEMILQNLPKIENQKGLHIDISNIKVKYAKNLPYVLDDVSLTIQPGEKIGIIGRTGAGKTSFVNMFMRFFDEYEGSIKLNGVELKNIYLESLRQNITFITQDSYFFNGSLKENIDPLDKYKDEEIIDLLKEAEVWDKVELLGGLEWQLTATGGQMSTGEKQIFCFLRAIINSQDLVIMDEATSNLDIKSEDILEKLKEKYMNQFTVLIIAHRLNTIHSCDKVLILEKGKVQEFTEKENLSKERLEYFENYLKMFD
jgi:ABC-type multidrug transport system fused ATPase/permease subunit